MKKTAATKQTERQIEGTLLQSNITSEDIELINFKKVNNVHTVTISDHKFDKESKHLISCLQSFGEGGNYFEINYDLMAFAMPELIGSKTFIELPSERRKDLFNQFAILRSVLNLLGEFVTEHNCTTSNN
jgi:hypothetical protein